MLISLRQLLDDAAEHGYGVPPLILIIWSKGWRS